METNIPEQNDGGEGEGDGETHQIKMCGALSIGDVIKVACVLYSVVERHCQQLSRETVKKFDLKPLEDAEIATMAVNAVTNYLSGLGPQFLMLISQADTQARLMEIVRRATPGAIAAMAYEVMKSVCVNNDLSKLDVEKLQVSVNMPVDNRGERVDHDEEEGREE